MKNIPYVIKFKYLKVIHIIFKKILKIFHKISAKFGSIIQIDYYVEFPKFSPAAGILGLLFKYLSKFAEFSPAACICNHLQFMIDSILANFKKF